MRNVNSNKWSIQFGMVFLNLLSFGLHSLVEVRGYGITDIEKFGLTASLYVNANIKSYFSKSFINTENFNTNN